MWSPISPSASITIDHFDETISFALRQQNNQTVSVSVSASVKPTKQRDDAISVIEFVGHAAFL
jgi:hypothetical protein